MRQQQFFFILSSFDKTFVPLLLFRMFFSVSFPNSFSQSTFVHTTHSRGSSISSDDFSSLASPDSLNDKPSTSFTASKAKLRRKLKNSQPPQQQQQPKMESSGGGVNAGSGHGKAQPFLKRRYSVPEIIMRK